MIHEKIREDMKEAMRAKESVRLSAIRSVLASATNELLAKKSNANFLDDEGIIAVIRKAVKQRKDSIEQFTKGGREDLALSEKTELDILEKYLPLMIPLEDIKKVAEAKKKELGITDKAKIGQLTGAIMKELKGKADGADVKTVVDSLFI